MLRNTAQTWFYRTSEILNEVLSLNAQEWVNYTGYIAGSLFLNEVLSLNAQEFDNGNVNQELIGLLNEVLSLNAQECLDHVRRAVEGLSSMKS